jgi:hypothetical protein
MTRENFLLEQEIQLLEEQISKKRSHKEVFLKKLNSLKKEQTNSDSMHAKLDKKMSSFNLVTISQNIENDLNKFQDLIGSDEKYQSQINTSLNEIERQSNEYLTREVKLFDQLLSQMFLKFEYDHIEKSIKLAESNEIKKILNFNRQSLSTTETTTASNNIDDIKIETEFENEES